MAERLELPTLPTLSRDAATALLAAVALYPLAVVTLGALAATLVIFGIGVLWFVRSRHTRPPIEIDATTVRCGRRVVARKQVSTHVTFEGSAITVGDAGDPLRIYANCRSERVSGGPLWGPYDARLSPQSFERLLDLLIAAVDSQPSAASPYRAPAAPESRPPARRTLTLVDPYRGSPWLMLPTVVSLLLGRDALSEPNLASLGAIGVATLIQLGLLAWRARRPLAAPAHRLLVVDGVTAYDEAGDRVTRDMRRHVRWERLPGGFPALVVYLGSRPTCLTTSDRSLAGPSSMSWTEGWHFWTSPADFEWLLDRLELRPRAAPPPTRVDARIEDSSEPEATATDRPARAVARRQSR